MNEHEFRATVARIRIQIPSHVEALNTIADSFEFSSVSAEPLCVFLSGMSGMGKTEILKIFARRHPPVLGDEVDQLPILQTAVPQGATIKGTAMDMLRALGDPEVDNSARRSGDMFTARIVKFLARKSTRMVIIDELNHITDHAKSKRAARETSDWIKDLIRATGIPFVVAGLPYCLTTLMENPQLARRVTRRHQLELFKWQSDEDKRLFKRFLASLEKQLPFTGGSGLAEDKTADWLFRMSQGLLGHVMNIVREASAVAFRRGGDSISRADLNEGLRKVCGGSVGPLPLGVEQPPYMARDGGARLELKA